MSTMDVPVPETNKVTERSTLSRVASPSSSRFEGKIVIVTPRGDLYVNCEEFSMPTARSTQESGEQVSAELVVSSKTNRIVNLQLS